MRHNPWQEGARNYFVNNLPLVCVVLLIFLAGVIFGALSIKTLDSTEKQDMVNHLMTFFKNLAGFEQGQDATSKDSIWLNVKTAVIIWLLGISTIGMPIIPVIIFLRGFVIGFTVGFLVNELSFNGIIFALVSILPQNLIIIPAIILAGVLALSFSVTILKSLITRRPIDFFRHLFGYSLGMLAISGALLVAGIIEAFVTPVFMKLAARILLKN